MIESKLNYLIPAQLLRLWISYEKDLVCELVALGEMVPNCPWQQRLLQLLERHFRRIGDYTQVNYPIIYFISCHLFYFLNLV